MNDNKKNIMYKQIKEHGDNLKSIFDIDIDSVELCKKLFRLENKAHRFTTDHCNYGHSDDEFYSFEDKILSKVSSILNCNKDIMFLNGDARGYALKFTTKFTKDKDIHADWGGYGIIAPNFRESA
jgi:hypothetical protein